MAENNILVDLERCTGCWTCAFSCKMGHGLDDKDWRIVVRTLGSGEGGDYACTESYPEPFCVHNCPSRALTYGDLDDPESAAGAKAAEMRAAGRRFFKLPFFEAEANRTDIQYVNRKI